MTIQRYLVIAILSIVTLATFSAALQGYKASKARLNLAFDEEMKSIAYTLKNSPLKLSESTVDTHSSFAFQVWQDNELKVTSTNAPVSEITKDTSGFSHQNFLGNRWRVYVISDSAQRVIVAQPVNVRIESIEEVLLEAILPIVFAIPIIGCLVYLAIRKSLKPLRNLSNQLSQKSSSDLSPITLIDNSSELVPIEQIINSLFHRLENAFEREQSMASNAAHELRTPISVLKLSAHNLRIAYKNGEIQQEHIEELDTNTARMAHVIEQVIALNRTSSENFEARKKAFDVKELLQEVISNNYEHIEGFNQTISLEADSIMLWADRFSLETVFENLVKNANKYSGRNSEILITAIEKEHAIEFTVQDSGSGIDEHELDKVFQRFYRVKQHTQLGSGLGMSIVKHLIDLHDGSITLSRSTLGGLKVSITFPKLSNEAINA